MPRLFVIMPFGRKAVPFGDGGVLDMDRVYLDIIKPAGELAGWSVLRIDEVSTPGLITEQYLDEILQADMVVAEISIPNANVFYELGIRQSVSSGGTVLIAHAGASIPFDLSAQRVLFYSLDTPEDIADARKRIRDALHTGSVQSSANPVRAFLQRVGAVTSPEVDPVAFERELDARIERSRNVDQLIAVWHWVKTVQKTPAGSMISLAARMAEVGEWVIAADVLHKAAHEHPGDFEIHRQRGWYLQQLGGTFDGEAEAELKRALELNPDDPETLGMMGGRLKRRGDFAGASALYLRAAELSRNSIYIQVNLAALGILADPAAPGPGIAAYRVLIEQIRASADTNPDEWAELVLGEAYFAVGDAGQAREHYQRALTLGASRKSLESAARQLQLFADVGFRPADARNLAQMLTTERLVLTRAVAAPTVDASLPFIVHLSDLHFGSLRKGEDVRDMHRFFDGENTQKLSTHIIEELTGSRSRVAGQLDRVHLVVSGDLVYTGTEAEFDQALACLNEICTGVGLPKERVHIVPGNHDINWTLSKFDPARRFDPFLAFLRNFFGEPLLQEKFPSLPSPLKFDSRPAAPDYVSISIDPRYDLTIVGFNSCVFETEEHHFGFVGERQLRSVRELLEKKAPAEGIRIAVIHHHLHPLPEMLSVRKPGEAWLDLSIIRDSGHVERYLEKLGFDVVLHGHKHKPQLRETLVRDSSPQQSEPRPLIVCGAGSVSCTELEHNEGNHYQILEFRQPRRRRGADFVDLDWRGMAVAPGAEWTTTATWKIQG